MHLPKELRFFPRSFLFLVSALFLIIPALPAAPCRAGTGSFIEVENRGPAPTSRQTLKSGVSSGWQNVFDTETGTGSDTDSKPDTPSHPQPEPKPEPGAHQTAQAGFDTSPIPGHPFTYIIPDPDRFDWKNPNRPGYRFRGMKKQHRNFYNYIKAKRKRGEPLTWGERLTIHLLQANRRWPEPPMPNEAAKRFMKHLRNKTDDYLNTAENLILAELFALGVMPYDNNLPPRYRAFVKQLQNGRFQARNFWERWFGRVEPWIDFAVAASGADMTDGNDSGSGQNGTGGDGHTGHYPNNNPAYRITYGLTGAELGPPHDWTDDRSLYRHHKNGTITGNKITLQVTPAHGDCKFHTEYGNFYTTIEARLWHGSKKASHSWRPEIPKRSQAYPCPLKPFRLEIPVGDARNDGGFSIVEHWHNPRYGDWEIGISGDFSFPAESRRQAWQRAFDEWHRQAEAFYRDYEAGERLQHEREVITELENAIRQGSEAFFSYLENLLGGPGENYTPAGREADKTMQAFGLGDDGEGVDTTELPPPPPRKPEKPKKRRRLNPYLISLKGYPEHEKGENAAPRFRFTNVKRITTDFPYAGVPQDSEIEAIWYRGGKIILRKTLKIAGSGTATFELKTGSDQDLESGTYEIWIRINGRFQARTPFMIL